MRGQTIVLRAFRGEPLLRLLWSVSEKAVFIHSQEEFEKRTSGEKSLDPVGFPLEDAFEYDESAKAMLAAGVVDWNSLNSLSG